MSEVNDRHKDVDGLVQEIYHEWMWGYKPQFLEDVKSKSEEEFAAHFYGIMGIQIRNTYGLWTKDTDLYNWFVDKGFTHADEMTNHVFVCLHRYALSNMKTPVVNNPLEIHVHFRVSNQDKAFNANMNRDLELTKKTFLQHMISEGHISVEQAVAMDEYKLITD